MTVDPLPAWRDGSAKEAILAYVRSATDERGDGFVPPADRVCVFDNDGTLWCEKPTYIQLLFAIQRLKDMAAAYPELGEKPAFKAAVEGDMGYFAALYPDHPAEIMQIVFDTHAGMSQPEFNELARSYLSGSAHPRFGLPLKRCVYQPMVELLRFLRAQAFKVFIASAGGMSFVRTVSEEIYSVPRENVIGSNVTFELRTGSEGPVLYRKAGLVDPIDDGPGKPVNIELHVGRRPILAGGNANGDIEMLEYTHAGERPSLCLAVRHDDEEREYAYEAKAEDTVFGLARERGWTIVSMKNDWNTVFG